jgi:hypothetical protein
MGAAGERRLPPWGGGDGSCRGSWDSPLRGAGKSCRGAGIGPSGGGAGVGAAGELGSSLGVGLQGSWGSFLGGGLGWELRELGWELQGSWDSCFFLGGWDGSCRGAGILLLGGLGWELHGHMNSAFGVGRGIAGELGVPLGSCKGTGKACGALRCIFPTSPGCRRHLGRSYEFKKELGLK